MQKALSHRYVHTIVNILLQNRNLVIPVSKVLQKYNQHAQSGLTEALDALYVNQSRRYIDENVVTPIHIVELVETLQNLYQQPDEDIRYQRGAILELFTYHLVRPRYKPGECVSNHRFVDGKYASDQIDVAALSKELLHLEGYECKLKVNGIESADCTNLASVADAAEQRGYEVRVGIVCWDESKQMRRKLKRLQPAECIELYGVDNLEVLEISLF